MLRNQAPKQQKPNGIPRAEDTPATVLIMEHYRRIGLLHGWTTASFMRLARLLNINPFELGRLCGIFEAEKGDGKMPDHSLLLRMMRKNHFPPHVALTLSLIEEAARRSIAARNRAKIDLVHVLPMEDLVGREPQLNRAD